MTRAVWKKQLATMLLHLGLFGPALVAGQPEAGADGEAPPGMKWIPAGEVTMGTDTPESNRSERSIHRAKIDGFWMDETPITNAQFRTFVEATGYVTTAEKPVDWEELKKQLAPGTPKPADEMLQPGSLAFSPPSHPVDLSDLANWWTWKAGANWRHPEGPDSTIDGRDDHPVVQVSWDDAIAYAKWAGKRLPTEAEWEYACRGGLEGKRYPWGNDFKPNGKFMANTFTGHFPDDNTAADGYAGTSPVRAFAPNGYGLFDMAGNVWNWTADAYRETPDAPPDEFRRVIKGGSFLCHECYCESYRPAARRSTSYDTGSAHVGFRCVKSVNRI